MIRKMVCILFTAMVLLNMGIQAKAAEDTGSIQISLNVGNGTVTSGAVTLYRIGTRIPEGYLLRESFGGGIVKEADACSPHLALWLTETAYEKGMVQLLDADGSTEYSDLMEGLYLVIQTEDVNGYQPFQPFLLTLPCEGQWNVTAQPKLRPADVESPRTGQDVLPFFGMIGMVISGAGLVLCTLPKRKYHA